MVKFAKFFSMKPDVEIMVLTDKQSRALSDLHANLFYRGWTRAEFSSLILQDNVFGFYARFINHDQLIGFVLSRIAADEAEILSIGIDKTIYRNGIGWRLMQAAIGEASRRGAVKIFLEVDEKNSAALGLYQKLGFLTIGQRQAYYNKDDNSYGNALVLALKLI